MADIFKDIVPSILQTKKDVLDDPKDYKPFLINRSLSYHMDCIMYVNQMNMNHSLPGKLQYQYLLNTIRPMKRKFAPWQKADINQDINCVKEYFGYSNQKAKEECTIIMWYDYLQEVEGKASSFQPHHEIHLFQY